MIEPMSIEEAVALLEAGGDARLACIVNGEPYVVPVHYVLDGDSAYMHSLPGTKVEAMRRHPRTCLQVQAVRSEHNWESVQAFGTYEEIVDERERETVFERVFHRFPRLTPADAVRRHGRLSGESIAFRIRIDRIVGVKEC